MVWRNVFQCVEEIIYIFKRQKTHVVPISASKTLSRRCTSIPTTNCDVGPGGSGHMVVGTCGSKIYAGGIGGAQEHILDGATAYGLWPSTMTQMPNDPVTIPA